MVRLRQTLTLLAILLVSVGLLAGCRGKQGDARERPARVARPVCPLDGLPTTEAAIARRPLAVMIENAPAARPQSGLATACVVYEAITEGGITRFMAVYLHRDAATVGPVRSVRPHFIQLSREYAAALVHCGESYEALQILAADPSIYDLDQMQYPHPFWRERARRVPHNLYTATGTLRAFMRQHAWEGAVSPLPRWYGDQPVRLHDPAAVAALSFGGAVKYRLRLEYHAEKGGYLRYMDGKLHVDRESGEALVARNVIIQRVRAEPYAASKHGTYDVTVTGAGLGYLLVDGRRTDIRWAKPSYYDITTYTDAAGAPLPLQPGQTWVEVLPADGAVSFPAPAAGRP